MEVPIVHIDQAGFGLVMAITIGAFDNIFANLYHRNDRAGAAIFAGSARNRNWNGNKATHIGYYYESRL